MYEVKASLLKSRHVNAVMPFHKMITWIVNNFLTTYAQNLC
jgi:hypothetical protein